MRLDNDTAFAAALFRSELPSGRMMASLLVRVAHPIEADGRLGLAERALAPIRRDRVPTPDGDLDPEIVFPRTATDLLILGEARPDEPSARAEVRIVAGPYRHVLRISGDRAWERGLAGLRPSPARPFASMPLAWDRAFGGAAPAEHGAIPWPANPRGRGYYLRERDAVDQPLANVEWAGEEVERWDDRPEPAIVGPYPSSWWSRLALAWELDVAGRRVAARPEGGLFDQAHPRLSGRAIAPGDPLRIDGVGAPIAAAIPACPVEAEFVLGERRCPRALALEEVLVDARSRRVELAWRKVVQYEYVRGQERAAIVTEARA